MPTYAQWIEASGNLFNQGRHADAMRILDGLITQTKDDPVALFMMGSGYLENRAEGTARVLLEKSVELAPDFDPAWHQLGVAYRKGEFYDESRDAFERCIQVNPDRPDTLAMLAGCHVNVGDPEPGEKWARKALELEPDEPHATNHLALCLLEQGKYREAWPYWEKRWRHPERARHVRSYGASVPKWDGKDLDGTLVIHGEQGLGDEIMYMSLLEHIGHVKAGRVVIECAERLVPLFKRSFGRRCYPTHEALVENEKQIDAWIPMGDLPMLFATDGPKPAKRFLKPAISHVSKMHDYLKTLGPRPWIGLAWYGGLPTTQAKLRNPPYEEFDWLINSGIEGTFVAVQYDSEAADEDAKILGLPFQNEIASDFDMLTALIDACDVVVSVLQTAVHQAGGLGKRCLVPTPMCTSWPFQLSGPIPWYESVELYRQPERDKWRPVFEDISRELRIVTQEKAA